MEQIELTDVNINGFRSYQGGYFKTLISPEQSNGELALLDFVLPKGAEPPPHLHTQEDETFYVLEGLLKITVGNITTWINAGEALFAPRNTPHHFKIISDTARFINLITPGRLWHYFIEFSKPCKGEPLISTSQQVPSQHQMQYMLQVLTNTYEIKFL
ncbi:cupin domain-containing protein [Parafilimonas terrae]|jgi:quercetin dioxygenase-like cupin family protein|uniref:Cupin domain protein n=1 Tax=Parafilimonas terrae TaxID=1465490 RepID=A0A1I5WZE7_9BACT|nr:cupin domain-containing protein [Parafilimonas terrae]SFQ25142.1 Cupin domain protein [Parafilimonas terrae]